MNQHFIIVNQIKADGNISHQSITRSSFGNALAEFYNQCRTAPMNANYVSTSVALMDSRLNVIKKEDIESEYLAEASE